MNQDGEWLKRHASDIGRQIAEIRRTRGLSAQRLADRCCELGMPSLNRAVLAKLENGRREAVSTAELMVLSRALEVAPMLLLFPLDHAISEVGPGVSMATWEAIRWFYGLPRTCTEGGDYIFSGNDPMALFEAHDFHIGHFYNLKIIGAATIEGFSFADELAAQIGEIRLCRDRIRALGLVPPSLPPDLSEIDSPALPPSLGDLLEKAAQL